MAAVGLVLRGGASFMSPAMAYATPADMKLRFDARVIGDLVDDRGQQVAADALDDDDVLATMLGDASGDINSALSVGQQYTPDDLAALTGNSQSHLVRITCEIALAYVFRRRGLFPAEDHKGMMDLAESHLDRIRRGQNVFNVPNREESGLIDTTGPSLVTFGDMHLIRDRTRNYFPARQPATWNQ